MRMSKLATSTTKEAPNDAELISHSLLVRAGYVKQQSAGIYSLLPLCVRSTQKISQIIREEMDAIDGQELLMPVVTSADLWRETGRYEGVTEELLRFKDRNNKDMVLNMTHEEVVTDIMRRYIKSYRQMPVMVYQIQTKYRDEARPRGGIIRLREFTMKDAYSFHATIEDLDQYYEQVLNAYKRIYQRCGLPVEVVQSDPGMMGGKIAHEFMAVTPAGEDTLILCPSCGYSANREVAVGANPASTAALEALSQGEANTKDLAGHFGVAPTRVIQIKLYKTAEGVLVVTYAPAGREINHIKLQNAVGAELQNVSEAELANYGLSGFASVAPRSLKASENVRILVDSALTTERNLVGAAGKAGHYDLNLNWERDFTGEVVDLTDVLEGQPCSRCGEPLTIARAIEVGNIFKLGTKYSAAMKCVFANEKGEMQPAIMGCYGIGVQRILASLIEKFNDARGMMLPITVAPYQVHVVGTDYQSNAETKSVADQLYSDLQAQGVTVLLDDRDVNAGNKFGDADLIGNPIQVIIGSRGLKNGQAEVKIRSTGETTMVALAELLSHVLGVRQAMFASLS